MHNATESSLSPTSATQIAREYEDFAYIVSHDLNAPLRHIREFTRLLIGARGDDLNEDEKEYVNFLETSLSRIDDMQTALLTFSRIDTRAGVERQTDLNLTIKEVLEELGSVTARHNTTIEYSDMPVVHAEPQQMRLLFFYLMDNALKFHEKPSCERSINITSEKTNGSWLIGVKDNGIGIAENHCGEIFRLFRRLNPEKFDGIGAGLTMARKIVRRHQGSIHVESELGKGTTVFFTLPA